jgi:large subunit ribosomal protein L15
VNLERIQEWVDDERLDPSKPITAKELYESRCIHSYGDGIKLLSRGNSELYDVPLHIVVSKASRAAIANVERVGGSILCKYYTANTLRALVKPHKYEGKLIPRDATPVNKRELVWYSNAANRGYLANLTPDKRPQKEIKEILEAAAEDSAALPLQPEPSSTTSAYPL